MSEIEDEYMRCPHCSHFLSLHEIEVPGTMLTDFDDSSWYQCIFLVDNGACGCVYGTSQYE